MQLSDAITPLETAASTAIEIRTLTKTFGTVQAVRGLDLIVPAGEIVAMLGPNGAGKSTTNEMILGLVKPDTGSVSVFGLDPTAAVRQGRVGAMLQGGALLGDATVRELLGLMHGLHAHPLPIAEVIECADLASFLTTKTDKLSGGQAQRLRYALAMMPDPDLLILDEPTVAMDVEIRRAFWASMRANHTRGGTATGRTVLFATHYLDEADEVADRIVVLAAGRIVADGTGAEIKSQVAGRTVAVADDSVPREAVERLPGVVKVETVGARLLIHAADSDALLRELLQRFPEVRDIEVTSARLEDAFLALTAAKPDATSPTAHSSAAQETR